ncbi:hypothetical protein [Piscinibacter sp. XHJ-5]|uniref:hypothetical protein n=1 Tax=Piscinibacter sp. XHJ-5 TaxID=3037797 RepID=UPI0024533029|nr:hypothetical protein [Piscinibacter sp. XHJ-5]
MSDRPIRHEGATEVEVSPTVRLGPSLRLTKEQLAAAQRTRDYHLRRMQTAFMREQQAGPDAATRES